MAAKYQLITELYRRTGVSVAKSPQAWQSFLSSACRNYKCRFDEQLLIYAQRPDAVAVAELGTWNKLFKRWVNKDSKGIAVFDPKGRRNTLKYYFDISDTHEGYYGSRPVPIWQMDERYEQAVKERLSDRFGEIEETDLAETLFKTAENAVEDNLPDYLSQLKSVTQDSFLEGLDEYNIEVLYKRLALLVLFFVVGVMRTCGNFAEIKRPEQALKLFIRFALAKGAVTYGLELMMALFNIVQGLTSTIMNAAGFGSATDTVLPQEIVTAVEDCGFFESIPLWAVTLIGGLFITVLSFIMIMSVYGRFFKLYLYTAIAPVPLSAFAGEPSQSVGKSFIKSYSAVCLEGAIIVLACIIFSLFAAAPPVVNPDAAAVTMVWSYVGELIFNMLILVGAVKMADRVVREMMGL